MNLRRAASVLNSFFFAKKGDIRTPPVGNDFITDDDPNPCAGSAAATLELLGLNGSSNPIDCEQAKENGNGQTGADVTAGYVGELDVGVTPLTEPLSTYSNLCVVNAHWHLGAEHRSEGEYDEEVGTGPSGFDYEDDDEGYAYDGFECSFESGTGSHQGLRCGLYDESDDRFTQEYDWEYCDLMQVGETYEVHWPYSGLGDCGTEYQFQTPFTNGVFCNALSMLDPDTLTLQDIANTVGVQAQVFTIINDEDYYVPDLIQGMVVNEERGMGVEITKYTGSTTGPSFDNEKCDDVGPVTWHVDRKCHLISASSFDKLCKDIKEKKAAKVCGESCRCYHDVDEDGCCYRDVAPVGSRPVVSDELAADNQVNRHSKNL